MKSTTLSIKPPRSFSRVLILASALMILGPVGSASAGRFVNISETATFPRGEGEVVQASAFSTWKDQSCRKEALELQVGVEYGLFQGFQVGFALPRVATVWTQEGQFTEVGGTIVWGLFNFVDPEARGWGLSLAAIIGENPDDRGGELALLAEKPLGDWTVVYNGIVGRSWARIEEFGKSDGMSHRLGASFQTTSTLFLGVEADWVLVNGEESSWETAGRYVGPNLSVETGPLWITAAAHFAFGPGDIIPEQVYQAQVGLPF